ncbi:universal stress protein [Pseudaestuariivita rosea]|uniref:universal stress protein n=1 Tax=Pseudaestuariivita rosea TaxID=2763263 RepID=UPI001ABA7535|nr:universal stress protein [Pseudaestuariivita rosea]
MTGHSTDRILFVFTGQARDQITFAQARTLAQTHQAELIIMGVIEDPVSHPALPDITGLSHKQIRDHLVQDLHDEILETLEIRENDIPVEVGFGKLFFETIRYVLRHDIDLVLKSAESHHGLPGYFFTSTDQHLLRKCPCPVWLQTRDQMPATQTAIAAVDVVPDGSCDALNARILQTAVDCVSSGPAEIHLTHIWQAPEAGMLWLWSNTPDPGYARQKYIRDIQDEHERALDQLIANQKTPPGISIIPQLHEGFARQKLVTLTNDLNADLLIIGSIARSGVPGVIIGNTAEDIINSTDCSVVTVKPPGFISPLA